MRGPATGAVAAARKTPRRTAGLAALIPLLALAVLIACGSALAAPPRAILIFHKQKGFIHTSTDSVVAVLEADLAARGFAVESTVDSLAFTAPNLARFGAVVFLNTNYRNGPLLARPQEAAFEAFVQAGGGFAGIHSAVPLNGAWEETVWPWYARLFGARFQSHPPIRTADFIVEDTAHASTRGLPGRFAVRDEWYAVQANPRSGAGVKVLARVDETGFPAGSGMGGDHPVSWCRAFEGGRSWVTLVGHDMSAFSDPRFLAHVRGGILWAGGWDTPASAARGRGREAAWTYRGRDGGILEVRVDGRRIEARRTETGAPRRR